MASEERNRQCVCCTYAVELAEIEHKFPKFMVFLPDLIDISRSARDRGLIFLMQSAMWDDGNGI